MTDESLHSELDNRDLALVLGSSGGIGSAMLRRLQATRPAGRVTGLSRSTSPSFDLTDEGSIAAAAEHLERLGAPLRLLVVATGMLHDGELMPERSLRELSPEHLARAYAINAIGPAMVLKHFAPLLPRDCRSVMAFLSARVGSIGDNRLGGWYAYRASKAALNQLIRTASIELKRTRPSAICVALHPGTVDTPLSAPFSKNGLDVRSPDEAAEQLLQVILALEPRHSGSFLDYSGNQLPW
jgi:NAD(P)-dependent dehydrogenase (short-subunit alcohol dehydrogenase family)